jgi:hypothetical protein
MNINGDNFCSRATKYNKKKKKQNTREHSPGKTHIKFCSNSSELNLSKEPMKKKRCLYTTWLLTFDFSDQVAVRLICQKKNQLTLQNVG